MSKLVTVYGGSGFVGRYIVRRLAKQGWRVRVAVRRPNEALFLKPYGAVGQVEPVFCNIRDDASVAAAMTGAEAVVNCVGIMVASARNGFDAVQAEGAGRIARLAAERGITRMVHISAIGADPKSDSAYARSKAAGEAAVTQALPAAVILRPSVIFGNEDQFFNRFAGMSRMGPILPLFGAETKFQPVYVDDVAQAAVKAVNGEVAAGVYELGGPDVNTFEYFIEEMLRIIQRRRAVIGLPFWMGSLLGSFLDFGQKASGGLLTNTVLTADQVKNLRHDNVVSPRAKGLKDLGIDPTPAESVLAEYLWRFRSKGQYNAIHDSAKNLKNV